MKKVKFKRKSKRIFFSTRIILLILLAIIVSISSAYALLSEKLTITGHINGEMVYTYYFLKPTNWNGSNLKAHIWGDDGTSSTEWPGKSMQYAGTLNGQSVYKVTVTSADPYYSTHKHIIFDDKVNGSDDNDHQTLDISLNPLKNNNQIFNTNLHHTSGTKRIFIRAPKTWNSLNVHLWNGSASDTVWPGISAQKLSEEGYYIEIDHGNGYVSVYMHLSKLLVKKGDTVDKGQLIGIMGCTGSCTGTHLHLTVYKNGKMMNPLNLYK